MLLRLPTLPLTKGSSARPDGSTAIRLHQFRNRAEAPMAAFWHSRRSAAPQQHGSTVRC
jgi:hypothetical protein